MVDHRALMERLVSGLNRREFSIFEQVCTEDYVEDYPQSGETIRGTANARAVREAYPSGVDLSVDMNGTMRNQPAEGIKVVAPTFAIVRVEGGGSNGTTSIRTRYPDGSLWWVVILYQLRGERICRATVFFAPEFPAPEWRGPYVERSSGGQ